MSTRYILHDRSRVVSDWQCPRRRLLAYEWGGRGLVNPHTSIELYEGTTVHDALAAIAAQHRAAGTVDIDTIATTSRDQTIATLLAATEGELDADARTFAREQGALVEGLIRAFHQHQWPLLTAAYPTILHVEEEMVFDYDRRGPRAGAVGGVWGDGAPDPASAAGSTLRFMSRPDLVVEAADGRVAYIEYKTTSTKQPGWINSWQTAVQLHSGVKAIEQTTGRRVDEVIVQGLYKGYVGYGRQNSPMCYAFVKDAQPPFVKERVSYEYVAGLRRQSVWERPGGVREWVRHMPPAMLADQLPQAPPIFVNHAIVDAFFAQTGVRERAIDAGMAVLLDDRREADHDAVLAATFPQRFDQCAPAYGRPCMFRRICHGGVTAPLTEGYAYRTPHHQPEVDAHAAVGTERIAA